ncbi:uncharacterized protein KZ484_003229 isoform 2-T2 [Pholidichthys leucotaenia]
MKEKRMGTKRPSLRFREGGRVVQREEKRVKVSNAYCQQRNEEEENHNQMAQENDRLLVTCGNISGFLDVEKLRKGEECIAYKGRSFAPPVFEDLAGKGSSRKWKSTIFYDGKPLQYWFEQGHLTTKGYKRTGLKTAENTLPSNGKDEDLSDEDLSDEDLSDEDLSEEETPGNLPLKLQKVKVMVHRLPEVGINTLMEPPVEFNSSPAEDRSSQGGTPQTSDPPLSGGDQNENEKFMQNHGQNDEQSETPQSAPPATSSADVTSPGHNVAHLKKMKLVTSSTQTIKVQDDTFSSMEVPPSLQLSASTDLDTMDSDQLTREKLKLQLKVLKLQEQYYTMKIKAFLS